MRTGKGCLRASRTLLPFATFSVPAVLAAALLAITPRPASAQMGTPLEEQCFASVQDNVPYDQGGHKHWNAGNVRGLCKGTTDPAATIGCFTAKIQSRVSWQQAIPACRAGSPRDAEAAAGINGRTATLVVFGSGGQRLGDYRQTGQGQWDETGADGSPQFHFKEVDRDDWSIYLVDRSRRVKIQLDLFTRQVKYSDATARQQRPLYDVMSASADQPATTGAPPAGNAAPAAGAGSLDASRALIRAGAVTDASDAGTKCSAVCQPYHGYSGHYAITDPPNLAMCQCNATPPADIKADEIASPPIQTDSDAGKICPTACQWYSGGDGTWRKLGDGTSVCGCSQQVKQ